MACKNIFLGDKIRGNLYKKTANPDEADNDNEFCPICSANKIEIMLDCSHFFCEKCIKTWLCDKKNTCPICRFNVDLKNVQFNQSEHWDLIDTKDLENYEKESAESLQKMIVEYLR